WQAEHSRTRHGWDPSGGISTGVAASSIPPTFRPFGEWDSKFFRRSTASCDMEDGASEASDVEKNDLPAAATTASATQHRNSEGARSYFRSGEDRSSATSRESRSISTGKATRAASSEGGGAPRRASRRRRRSSSPAAPPQVETPPVHLGGQRRKSTHQGPQTRTTQPRGRSPTRGKALVAQPLRTTGREKDRRSKSRLRVKSKRRTASAPVGGAGGRRTEASIDKRSSSKRNRAALWKTLDDVAEASSAVHHKGDYVGPAAAPAAPAASAAPVGGHQVEPEAPASDHFEIEPGENPTFALGLAAIPSTRPSWADWMDSDDDSDGEDEGESEYVRSFYQQGHQHDPISVEECALHGRDTAAVLPGSPPRGSLSRPRVEQVRDPEVVGR
ncbi:unnamed protein product, partial [Amoebophrya sp. A120]